MIVKRNTIEAFHGSWGSGLGSLSFQEGGAIHCENGPTVRNLDAATGGNVIAPGHTVNQDGIRGLDIIWFEDEIGLLLGGFILTSDWEEQGYPDLEYGIPYEITETDEGVTVEKAY